MAECSIHKHENLSSNPQYTLKKLSACLHSCGESETGGPPGTTGHQPNSRFSKRPCHRSKQKANRLGCRASYYGLLVHIFIDHTYIHKGKLERI